MSFDNLCKLFSEKHPDRFAAWLLEEPRSVEVLKTDVEPIVKYCKNICNFKKARSSQTPPAKLVA